MRTNDTSTNFLIIFSTLCIITHCISCSLISNTDNNTTVQESYITQKLDHFDNNNHATYQQRYFVSYEYYNNNSNNNNANNNIISLLCVGGEGPGFTKSVLINSDHCSGDMIELAKRLYNTKQYEGVVLYALEHRYYGESYPTFYDNNDNGTMTLSSSPLTIDNLRYLSSRQALEDLAYFVHTINMNNQDSRSGDSSSSNTWITFGGSYPGLLSMYARYKYPHLIYASVSSSAPIELIVDFPGYKSRQSWDLKYEKIGGSIECHRIVVDGHKQAVHLLHNNNNTITNGPIVLANKFNLCNPNTTLSKRRNQEKALGDGLIDIPSQSNDPSCVENDICNINKLCQFMIQETEKIIKVNNDNIELEVLVKVAKKQQQVNSRYKKQHRDPMRNNKIHRKKLMTSLLNKDIRNNNNNVNNDDDNDNDCNNIDFEDMIKFISNEEIKPFGYRSWLWQTCTEFGFYQTCIDNHNCPFAPYYHMIDLDLEICSRVFNITNVYDNVQSSIDTYGGKDAFINNDTGGGSASNILIINGNVDPWSVLGLQENESSNYLVPVKVVDGASHHFWTHPVKDTDDHEIKMIREYIYSVIMEWLAIKDDKISVV